jgi:hypothetical protein
MAANTSESARIMVSSSSGVAVRGTVGSSCTGRGFGAGADAQPAIATRQEIRTMLAKI